MGVVVDATYARVRVNENEAVSPGGGDTIYRSGDVIDRLNLDTVKWLNENHKRVTVLDYLDPEDDSDEFVDSSTDFEQLEDVGPSYADALHEAGYETIADLREATLDELADVVPESVAESIIAQV